MPDILLDQRAVPATSTDRGKSLAYVHANSKSLQTRDDVGRFASMYAGLQNWNTADVVANAADTYLAGSQILVPAGQNVQNGTVYKCTLVATKTAAGVATPIWAVRMGTAGTVADTARLTFTGPAQTAAVDTGVIEIIAVFNSVGASTLLAGGLNLSHNLATTGFSVQSSVVLQVTSAAFDTTPAGLILGLSVNPGAAGVWTHQVIHAELLNL